MSTWRQTGTCSHSDCGKAVGNTLISYTHQNNKGAGRSIHLPEVDKEQRAKQENKALMKFYVALPPKCGGNLASHNRSEYAGRKNANLD